MSKHILLGISGGIATCKPCELVRRLEKAEHSATVAVNRSATEFVSPLTFQALSGNPVLSDTYDGESMEKNGMAYISLTHEADVFLVAPTAANTVAKTANGITDSLLTNLAVARKCPLAAVPAMNVEIWFNPANQCNIRQLVSDGITVLRPDNGKQACGETGVGRMPKAAELADLLPDLWTPKVLNGRRVLITAGTTLEAIDPVRDIANIPGGRIGMALAVAYRAAGVQIALVYSQFQAAVPIGLAHTVQAVSAEEMYRAVHSCIVSQDVFISVTAVTGYKVKNSSNQKLREDGTGAPPIIESVENPDILASVAALPSPSFCVGFAAESENVLEHARAKRSRKNVPMLVAGQASQAMGKTTSQITIINDRQETSFPESDKRRAAEEVVKRLAELLG